MHFYLAAIAYEYHKDVQETLNFLESIPPENRFYDRALRLRIQLLHDQQRYEDAMQLILQGQSQFPTERDFRLMEIHLYLLQDRYKEALTAATAAQQIWPSDDEIAYVYGSVLDSLGRKREALAVMESIVARNPEDYQALNYVGYSLAEPRARIWTARSCCSKRRSSRPLTMRTFWTPSPGRTSAGARTPRHGSSSAGRQASPTAAIPPYGNTTATLPTPKGSKTKRAQDGNGPSNWTTRILKPYAKS